MQKIPFLTLVKSIVSLRCCSIIYCCLTNHPKIQLLKTTTILLVMILQLRNLSGWLITSVDSVCWAYSCGHIPLMAGRAGSSEVASFTCLRPLCWLSAGMPCFSVFSCHVVTDPQGFSLHTAFSVAGQPRLLYMVSSFQQSGSCRVSWGLGLELVLQSLLQISLIKRVKGPAQVHVGGNIRNLLMGGTVLCLQGYCKPWFFYNKVLFIFVQFYYFVQFYSFLVLLVFLYTRQVQF